MASVGNDPDSWALSSTLKRRAISPLDFTPRFAHLRKLPLPALIVAEFLLLAFAKLPAQAPPAAAPQPASVEANRKALNDLFEEYWQATLEHSPEFASWLGDKRYNDRIDDYSVKAENDWLEREESFMMRLAAIDTAGLTDQEKISRDLLLRQFADDAEAAQFKEWEMPLNQLGGIYTAYPQLAAAVELYHGKGLRRLDRPPARHSQGLRPGDHQYVHRHGRPSRAASLSAGKGAGAGQAAGLPKARGFAAGRAAQEVSRLRQARRAGAHQGRDAGRHRQRGAARLPALCALS